MGQNFRANDVDICRKQTPVFRSTSPLSREVLKGIGGGTLSIRYCAGAGTIETVFRTIISVNQLSLYGAVAEMCEECESCHVRTGRPVLAGQSNPLFFPSVMKTNIPLTDDPAQEGDPLQRYRERIEKLSQQDRVSKFCTDAGFLTKVEVGVREANVSVSQFHGIGHHFVGCWFANGRYSCS